MTSATNLLPALPSLTVTFKVENGSPQPFPLFNQMAPTSQAFLSDRTGKGLMSDAQLQSIHIVKPKISPTTQGQQAAQGHFHSFLE